jgi:hypothetical protein
MAVAPQRELLPGIESHRIVTLRSAELPHPLGEQLMVASLVAHLLRRVVPKPSA